MKDNSKSRKKIIRTNTCKTVISNQLRIIVLLKLPHDVLCTRCKCLIASRFISQHEWRNSKPRQLNGLTNIMQQHALQ